MDRSLSAAPASELCDDGHAAARYLVTLMPSGWQFDVPADMPILLAAQAAGIKLPSSCRNGTCRACLCQVRTGIDGSASAPVVYRIEWPGLSRDEKAQGWLLPCCAYARDDLVIDAPDAVQAVRAAL